MVTKEGLADIVAITERWFDTRTDLLVRPSRTTCRSHLPGCQSTFDVCRLRSLNTRIGRGRPEVNRLRATHSTLHSLIGVLLVALLTVPKGFFILYYQSSGHSSSRTGIEINHLHTTTCVRKWRGKCPFIFMVTERKSKIRNATQDSRPISRRLMLNALPRTTEQAEAVLTQHVLECRHCLAVALYQTETLAQLGCREYKILLNRAEAGIELHLGGHLDGLIGEEYCLNHLIATDRQRVEDHISACHDCVNVIDRASRTVSHIKAGFSALGVFASRAAAGAIR
jgi:hypothetical protein